jgi:hypothetical protein
MQRTTVRHPVRHIIGRPSGPDKPRLCMHKKKRPKHLGSGLIRKEMRLFILLGTPPLVVHAAQSPCDHGTAAAVFGANPHGSRLTAAV